MEHTEKIKGQVTEIIAWEKREKYFSKDRMNYGATPVDLVVIGKIKIDEEGWLKRLAAKDDYNTMWVNGGVPITVERPHDLKVGDIMELELTIKRVKKSKVA